MAQTKESLAGGIKPYDYKDPNRQPLAPRMIEAWQVAQALDNAGFPESEWVTGVAIARRESSFVPDLIGAVNSSTRDYDPENASWDFGLWQISYRWHSKMLHEPQYDWKNPTDNAKMAKRLFDASLKTHGSGWRPWHTYTSGNYAVYLELAREGVAEYKRRKAAQPTPPKPTTPTTPKPTEPTPKPPQEVQVGRMPAAQWRPISGNHRKGGNSPRLFIVHTIEGSLAGADSWFRNPASRVSSHFGTGKNGVIYQWVDTKDVAWANAGANSFSVSIENEGKGSEPFTPEQIEAIAQTYAWAHRTHGIPLAYATSSTGSGLGYHRQFGPWSLGGTSCPGDKRIAQLPQIMARAAALVGGAAPKPPVTTPSPSTPSTSKFGPAGSVRSVGSQQKEVNLAGYTPKLVHDSTWGTKTEAGVKWYQKKIGVTADGVWGPKTDAAHKKYKAAQKKGDSPSPKPSTPEPPVSKKNKLKVDGILGPNTIKELQRALNEGRF